jgi:2,3-bisphosphoglycerate-dependent phosphoglycerate mutase
MRSEKGTLILLRHGASIWNEKNLFTGWVDIPLSSKGVEESMQAGKAITSFPIDMIFTSTLIRAQMTAMLAMISHPSGKIPCVLHPEGGILEEWAAIHDKKTAAEIIPVREAWQLNERMYGELQGMNKDEMRQKFGAEQVHTWRRSFDAAPPGGESLKMTSERTLPYFQGEVLPFLDQGKHVLIVAHGNSLRSIAMMLENLSPKQVVELEFPTGAVWVYKWQHEKWSRHGK